MSNRKPNHGGPTRVGLVTEELAGGRVSGGIGSAFHELALALARAGFAVDIIYMPVRPDADELGALTAYYAAHGIRVETVCVADHAWETGACEARSYALLHHLRGLPTSYDILHIHEYKGLGFFPIRARQQALALADTTIIVQCHGPTRWALEANGHPFSHEDQLKIDLMEQGCVAGADIVVSPSRYLLDWFKTKGWRTPPASRMHVIQNVCTGLLQANQAHAHPGEGPVEIDEIVFFGRHEERKGIAPFCDALDRMADRLRAGNVRVSFLGRFGAINGQPSALYLSDRARRWDFPIEILPDMDRAASTRHLAANPRSLVVIPSPVENSPYTVLEAAVLGKALLTSDAGGAHELLSKATADACTCQITGKALADRMLAMLDAGPLPATLSVPPAATEKAWVRLHRDIVGKSLLPPAPTPAPVPPMVTVVITHHERPRKLYDAVMSIAQQTYANIDLVVIDDGSQGADTIESLARLQPLLKKLGATFLTQENAYLGAARNRASRSSTAEYLLFLDDDDIALPTLVQTLVTAAEATRADVMQCLNLFMDVDTRGAALPYPEQYRQKVSYLPLGGPLSLAPMQNVFGSATSLIRRSAFVAIGGYTEQFGVGHEDYELYVRLLPERFARGRAEPPGKHAGHPARKLGAARRLAARGQAERGAVHPAGGNAGDVGAARGGRRVGARGDRPRLQDRPCPLPRAERRRPPRRGGRRLRERLPSLRPVRPRRGAPGLRGLAGRTCQRRAGDGDRDPAARPLASHQRAARCQARAGLARGARGVSQPDPGAVFLRTTQDLAESNRPLCGLASAVGNTGNYFFEHALLRHLGNPTVVHAVEDVPQQVDRLVLSMANFVSGATDLGYVVDCLERKEIRQIVMIGAGAQAYDYGDDIALTAGTARFLAYVADHSVTVGVRGCYTAEVLNDLGVRNVEVIGCPAAFWSGPQAPIIRQDTLPYLPAIAVNATPVGHFRDKVSALFAFGMRHEADYIAQAEGWIADLADGPVSEPYVPLHDADAVSYFAYPACTPTMLATWLRRHARWFFQPQVWIDQMRRYDLSVGARFHGNLAAIQAGTPALNLVFDTRMRELCDYLALPYMMLSDFTGDLSPQNLHERADYGRYAAAYGQRFETYRAFLTASGIEHSLAPALPLPETAPPASLSDRVRARIARQIADDAVVTGRVGPESWDATTLAMRPMRSRQERSEVEAGQFTQRTAVCG